MAAVCHLPHHPGQRGIRPRRASRRRRRGHRVELPFADQPERPAARRVHVLLPGLHRLSLAAAAAVRGGACRLAAPASAVRRLAVLLPGLRQVLLAAAELVLASCHNVRRHNTGRVDTRAKIPWLL